MRSAPADAGTPLDPLAAMDALDAEVSAEWAIRPELPIDIDQIHELHRAAFPGAAEAELVDAVRASAGFIGELSLVAVTADGSVLGHVMVSLVTLHPEPESAATHPPDQPSGPAPQVLALAPIAVLPVHRDRGIGSALMRAALAGADARDEPFVVVLGSADFCGRFGFEPASGYGVTGPYDVPDEIFQLRPRSGSGDVPSGRIEYPAAFEGV
jgi:putative acetyltransferase